MLHRLRRYTRGKRLERFNSFVKGVSGQVRLIDLGGTVQVLGRLGPGEAAAAGRHDRQRPPHRQESRARSPLAAEHSPSAGRCADAVAADLAEYDVIFSNSLIEHLPSPEAQRQLAQAIIDSGRPYFLQTPNKRSPVDPHFPRPYVPFFAAYPRPLQARLLSWSALGSGSAAPSYAAALERLSNYYPLTTRGVRQLFPQARIVMERPLGVPMSIIAMSEARA